MYWGSFALKKLAKIPFNGIYYSVNGIDGYRLYQRHFVFYCVGYFLNRGKKHVNCVSW